MPWLALAFWLDVTKLMEWHTNDGMDVGVVVAPVVAESMAPDPADGCRSIKLLLRPHFGQFTSHTLRKPHRSRAGNSSLNGHKDK